MAFSNGWREEDAESVLNESVQKSGLSVDRFNEIAHDYADIVRVGRVILNGHEVTWEPSGNKVRDLGNFCEVIQMRMHRLFSSIAMDPETLSRICYWVCKGLSMNYVLWKVMEWLKQVLSLDEDSIITIATEKKELNAIVEYFVDVGPGGQQLQLGMTWPWTGNIYEISPHAQTNKILRGTLYSIQTEFACPPAIDFKPVYKLRLNLKKRSRMSRMAETARTAANKVAGRSANNATSFLVDAPEPLRSRLSVGEGAGILAARAGDMSTDPGDERAALELVTAGHKTPHFDLQVVDPFKSFFGEDSWEELSDGEPAESFISGGA